MPPGTPDRANPPRGEQRRAGPAAAAMQAALIEALRNPACYPHPVQAVRVIETHISFVLLTGRYAYKIKKAVDLGFVDFSTLARRKHFCDEEIRLNARAAPSLYLGVAAIGGNAKAPVIDGHAPAIEYAVKMREFSQDALADRALARGEFGADHIDALALRVAELHRQAQPAGAGEKFGDPAAIAADAAQNFSQIRDICPPQERLVALTAVEAWTVQQQARLETVFAARKHEGRVRECHGDLHLGNVVLVDGGPQPFDCIEFNPAFRWIDVISEIAFLAMDLQAAAHPGLAARFINAYLEISGDYDGLQVLRYYLVYRAMVRAKVSLMRARQLAGTDPGLAPLQSAFRRYLALARDDSREPVPFVVITHGLSGSGKTTLTQPLIEMTGAVRLRSDVERKRLHGLEATARRSAAIGEGLYGRESTAATYRRLLELTQLAIGAGQPVIVDATFLTRAHRDRFRRLAAAYGARFAIIDFTTDARLLRERVAARASHGNDASDADLAVLESQLTTAEPLQADELASVFRYDASQALEYARHRASWRGLLQRLGIATGEAAADQAPFARE